MQRLSLFLLLCSASLTGTASLNAASLRTACSTTRVPPASPLEMALQTERQVASGVGVLLPMPEYAVQLDGGVIPLDGNSCGFPMDFFAGLVPENTKGVDVWHVTLRADDDSGDMVFYNADGQAFWSVMADPSVYEVDWVAQLHSPDSKSGNFFDTVEIFQNMRVKTLYAKVAEEALYRSAWATTQQYLRPSHVEMTFTFVRTSDLETYFRNTSLRPVLSLLSAEAGEFASVSAAAQSFSSVSPLTGLTLTSIEADTNGVALSAAWPENMSLAGGALDLFFSPVLAPPAWTNLLRIATSPATNELHITVPYALLPPAPEPVSAVCVTNIRASAYDPGVLVTNIICTNAVRLTTTGFFRLADLADTDSNGLTDAFEKWVLGRFPESQDSDNDGMPDIWEIANGLNPASAADASGDNDNDGLTNLAEYMLRTDPNNPDTAAPLVIRESTKQQRWLP